jgi:hypothetical protein
VLIVVINVPFHLFQEVINQFTVVIALESTNQMSQEMTEAEEMIEVQDIPEMIEIQDIPETTEVQDIPETTEVQDIPETTEVQDIPEIILDLVEEEVINF